MCNVKVSLAIHSSQEKVNQTEKENTQIILFFFAPFMTMWLSKSLSSFVKFVNWLLHCYAMCFYKILLISTINARVYLNDELLILPFIRLRIFYHGHRQKKNSKNFEIIFVEKLSTHNTRIGLGAIVFRGPMHYQPCYRDTCCVMMNNPQQTWERFCSIETPYTNRITTTPCTFSLMYCDMPLHRLWSPTTYKFLFRFFLLFKRKKINV